MLVTVLFGRSQPLIPLWIREGSTHPGVADDLAGVGWVTDIWTYATNLMTRRSAARASSEKRGKPLPAILDRRFEAIVLDWEGT